MSPSVGKVPGTSNVDARSGAPAGGWQSLGPVPTVVKKSALARKSIALAPSVIDVNGAARFTLTASPTEPAIEICGERGLDGVRDRRIGRPGAVGIAELRREAGTDEGLHLGPGDRVHDVTDEEDVAVADAGDELVVHRARVDGRRADEVHVDEARIGAAGARSNLASIVVLGIWSSRPQLASINNPSVRCRFTPT